jgi:hypothetical protein
MGKTAMGNGGMRGQFGGNDGVQSARKNFSRVWYFDKDGNLAMQPLRTGATNGSMTEIVAARNLNEGMQVISGSLRTSSQAQKSSTQTRTMRGPGFGPPPPGF